MNQSAPRVLYWAPRIICIGFAAFLGIFALDVFDMPVGFDQKLLALLMHLIPSLIVLLTLAVVWRHEWVGTIVFPLLALVHLVTMWGRLHWSAYAAIEAPLVLLGVLFGINWRHRVQQTLQRM